MTGTRKALTAVLWIVIVMLAVGLFASWTGRRMRQAVPAASADPAQLANATAAPQLEPLFEVPRFSLTDQNGATLGTDQLRGKVWIGAFIFTRCAGPCPLITSHMAQVHKSLTNPGVRLVSFSLDPTYDTPAVLKRYAQDHGADDRRWYFLTGTASQIYDIARGMKIGAAPATADRPITHSTKLVLVDQRGWIRGYYDSGDDESLRRIAADADALAKSAPAAGGVTQ